MLKLREDAARRGYFERSEEFDPALQPILDSYNVAAKNAASYATIAVREGDVASMRVAQWWEAVTLTLERTLSTLKNNGPDEEVELPPPPKFD